MNGMSNRMEEILINEETNMEDTEGLEDLMRLDGIAEDPQQDPGQDALEGLEEIDDIRGFEEIVKDEISSLDSDLEDAEHPELAEDEVLEGPVTVVGVRFRTAGRIYYFSPGEFTLKYGERVVVETSRGLEMGTVVSLPMEIEAKKSRTPLRTIIRIADAQDREREAQNRIKEREAYKLCEAKIRSRGLEMKLIDAEYTFDNSKILFYFTADGRVDFRDLVKDLAGVFHMRIELRQIGVRDETKILGGYGSCGRPLCCHTYLADFAPVSIKMAKEQNLSLNPSKISGVCGRLMCCLKNEEDTYEELNRNLPHPGDEVETGDGMKGEVESVNVLRQRVRIIVEVDDEKELHEYSAQDITITRKRRRSGSGKNKARTRVERGTVVRDKTGIRAAAKEPVKNEAKEESVSSAPARNGAANSARPGRPQSAPAEERQERNGEESARPARRRPPRRPRNQKKEGEQAVRKEGEQSARKEGEQSARQEDQDRRQGGQTRHRSSRRRNETKNGGDR